MRSSSPTSRAAWRRAVGFVSLLLVGAGCNSPGLPDPEDLSAEPSTQAPVDESTTAVPTPTDVTPTTSDGREESDADVLIRDDLDGRSIDRRVLGTNVPAWLGPDLLADPAFVDLVNQSGVTLLRMPGGSWSNAYNWSACETADATQCYWPWAAWPSDFADFMQATGLRGLWTVSINETAQSAAAAVAFFNGQVDDQRVIGPDRNGVDWGTVGSWAQLRVSDGNIEPVPITLWEVGNEVYGGRPDTGGSECASFGWEDVWTCSGTTYVQGDDDHDGYLAIRAAMVAVDPTIEVGAVGVGDPSSWSDWGDEVIEAAGDDLDFYSVHQYGFDASPDDEQALTRPAEMWPTLIDDVRSALPARTPIAVTEYNLVSNESGDADRSMTRAVNALYMADTVGQLVSGDVAIANQWNLANGTTTSGTDYGMIDITDLSLFPQYHALALWGQTGDSLLTSEGSVPDGVRIYPTQRADGSTAIVLINLSDSAASFDVAFAGGHAATPGTMTTLRADSLDSDVLTHGVPTALNPGDGGDLSLSLPPWSLNLLEVESIG